MEQFEIKYHVRNSGEMGVIPQYNEYDTLEEALIAGEMVLDEYREYAYEEYEWDYNAFSNEIFDSTGRVYYKAHASGRCDEATLNYQRCEECELGNDKTFKKCKECKLDIREYKNGASLVEDVKWIRCYSFIDIHKLFYYFAESEKHRDMFFKLWKMVMLGECEKHFGWWW